VIQGYHHKFQTNSNHFQGLYYPNRHLDMFITTQCFSYGPVISCRYWLYCGIESVLSLGGGTFYLSVIKLHCATHPRVARVASGVWRNQFQTIGVGVDVRVKTRPEMKMTEDSNII
jgi:hypothetical protein